MKMKQKVYIRDFCLASELWEMKREKIYTDVEIVCKNGSVLAHRAILACNYSPFKTLFKDVLDEEIVIAKDFTKEEVIKDVTEMYFPQGGSVRTSNLKCFKILASDLSFNQEPREIVLETARRTKKVFPVKKEVIADLIGDSDKDDVADPEYKPKKKNKRDVDVNVKEGERIRVYNVLKGRERRAKEVAPPGINRYVGIPPDPAGHIQNSRTETGEQPGCIQCGLVFENYEDQEIHIQKHMDNPTNRHNPDFVIRCDMCINRVVMNSYEKYEKHLKGRHRRLKCRSCYKIIANELHDCMPSSFSCAFCLKYISTEEEFMAHQKNLHSVFNCEFCNKCYKTKEETERHQQTCMRQVNPNSKGCRDNNPLDVQGDAFNCIHCEVVTASVKLLLYHIRIKHYNGDVCTLCNTLIKNRNIHGHGWIHIKEEYRRFKCDHCDRRFISISKKKEHENSKHVMNKPLKCKFCDKGFARSSKRADHQNSCKKNPDRTKRKNQPPPYNYICPLVSHNKMMSDFRKKDMGIIPEEEGEKSTLGNKDDVNSQIMALLGKK